MKKLLSFCLALAIIICAVPMGAFTLDVSAETDGYYTYSVLDGKATITDVDTSISGDITIPDTLGGYPVTSIGNYAFEICTSLTSITIPDSVTSIGYGAFERCASLTSITIPDSVTSIGDYAFEGCDSLTSVAIPDSVTSIGEYAFRDCTSLTSITIPDSVTSIGYGAFLGCTSLTSITIPDNVTSIGDCAFLGCDSLTSVTIPDSVTSIGYHAFYWCESLTSITIPDSVTSIGDGAFVFCYNLTSINIPDNVTSIGYEAFWGCTSLTSITIGGSVTSIGERAFYECDSMVSVTLPASVTSIGEFAFDDCFRLSKIWYMGNQEEKDAIKISAGNSDLLTSTWYYNSCIESETHTYDNNADMLCNVCNASRKVGGDANGDGETNNKDLGILMRYINDWDIEINTEDVDMNADGKINNRDYGILMRSLNGWTGDDIYSEGTNTGTNTGTSTPSTPDTPSTPSNPTSLKLVTDQDKILKDAFALGKNQTTPYIAQLTGKVISIEKAYNEQYDFITAIITVGGKNITCYNMKVGSVSGGSKLKAGDTITVQGVIKNFYRDETSTSGTVEFSWDEASQTEVVLTELVVAVQPSTQLSVVDNPVVGTAYKFGFLSTEKDATYYAAGGMSGYYMATSTSPESAIDVYLESANGGYYVYAMINGAKKYLDLQETGTHVNAVYVDKPGKIFTFHTESKTLVAQCTKNGVTGTYAFGTHGSYTTIGSVDIAKENYRCHFYK